MHIIYIHIARFMVHCKPPSTGDPIGSWFARKKHHPSAGENPGISPWSELRVCVNLVDDITTRAEPPIFHQPR